MKLWFQFHLKLKSFQLKRMVVSAESIILKNSDFFTFDGKISWHCIFLPILFNEKNMSFHRLKKHQFAFDFLKEMIFHLFLLMKKIFQNFMKNKNKIQKLKNIFMNFMFFNFFQKYFLFFQIFFIFSKNKNKKTIYKK